MTHPEEYAEAFEAVARCAIVGIMLLLALTVPDMIATGAESAAAVQSLGSDAVARMEVKP